LQTRILDRFRHPRDDARVIGGFRRAGRPGRPAGRDVDPVVLLRPASPHRDARDRDTPVSGGRLRFRPWVGWLSLTGALAAAGLPPLNGFVSEWLLLQSFLFTLGLKSTFVNNLVPVVAAGIALVAMGLSKVHAAAHGYDFTASARFGWSLAFIVAACGAAYAMGLPDLVRNRRAA